ncbi:MAG: YicC family protein [Simkaniaceae bacterium]|nr:YicC family protein [Simkaniaceae bacterium]MCF7852953.1 YicC family protein [Simkaniaceae bacterium]
MTAFGRADISTDIGDFYLEIYSVNKKNLDVSTFVPKDFFMLDLHLRKWIQRIAERGSISIRLMREAKKGDLCVEFDEENLGELKTKLNQIAMALDMPPVHSIEFLAEMFLRMPHREMPLNREKFLADVRIVFDKAAKDWIAMREREGVHLAQDIEQRLNQIEQHVEAIENGMDRAPQKFAEKLKNRLQEAGVFEQKDEERVIKEVVVFSEKVDTTEEIIRLKSHVKQFNETLCRDESMGRKLDFLIQEMNREVNSLGVKCFDLEMIKRVLEIKSELEKIREQVQNIE